MESLSIYVDDLINELRCSGYGVHIGSVFVAYLNQKLVSVHVQHCTFVTIVLWRLETAQYL